MRPTRFALAALLGLAACSSDDTWFGASEDPPLPGERVSVMLLEREVNADPSLANLPIQLPPPQLNDAWPQNGGNPTHVMNHLAASDQLSLAWRASIGEGSPGKGQLLARPVVANGRVFTMDGEATIRALTVTGSDTPIRWNFRVSRNRSIFDWSWGSTAQISSRKSVPPSACSAQPT